MHLSTHDTATIAGTEITLNDTIRGQVALEVTTHYGEKLAPRWFEEKDIIYLNGTHWRVENISEEAVDLVEIS